MKKTKTKPFISVVTPALNCEKYIRQCIKSVVAQNYDHFEHIIIDGKSEDKTLNIPPSPQDLVACLA